MRRIVLLDDDREVVDALEWEILKHLSADVVIEKYTCPAVALSAVCEYPPSLMFVDLMMPACDGIQFIRACRMKGIDTPVIIVSAYVAEYNLEKLLPSNGVVATICKPFSEEEIRVALAREWEPAEITVKGARVASGGLRRRR